MWLGIGETIPEGPSLRAQQEFINAVQGSVPECVSTLAAIAATAPGERNLSMVDELDEPTEDLLRAWAQGWGWATSHDGWLMRFARREVTRWRERPDEAGRFGVVVKVYREPRWPSISWNANDEREDAFRQRVEKYIAHVKTLQRETPGVNNNVTGFAALALEHVAESPLTTLSARFNTDTRSLSRQNKRLAGLAGLTLRRRGAGRIRGRKRTGK